MKKPNWFKLKWLLWKYRNHTDAELIKMLEDLFEKVGRQIEMEILIRREEAYDERIIAE